MKIELMAPAELVPYAKNPRKNQPAVDYVANSIREFGFRNPILIDKDKVIIAGHTRLLAAEKLGIKQVPVIRIEDLTPDQVKALRLADNKTGEFAEWDRGLLDEELADLRSKLDMRDFGFLDPRDQDIDEDSVPELPVTPKAQLGDIYQLGAHRVMCGDSTKAEDVAQLMDGREADLLVTDPPYNVAVNKTKSKAEAKKRHRRTDGLTLQNDDFSDRQILNDDMDEAAFASFLEAAFASACSVLRKGGGVLRLARQQPQHDLPEGARGGGVIRPGAARLGQGPIRPWPAGLPVETRALFLRMEAGRRALLRAGV